MTINVDKTINQPFGNGKHTTYKNGDDWGIVYYCFIHISHFLLVENTNNEDKLKPLLPVEAALCNKPYGMR